MKGKNGMKECPNCKELVGDNVRVCFNCNYDFLLKKVIDQSAERKRREEEEQRIRDAQERQYFHVKRSQSLRRPQCQCNP